MSFSHVLRHCFDLKKFYKCEVHFSSSVDRRFHPGLWRAGRAPPQWGWAQVGEGAAGGGKCFPSLSGLLRCTDPGVSEPALSCAFLGGPGLLTRIAWHLGALDIQHQRPCKHRLLSFPRGRLYPLLSPGTAGSVASVHPASTWHSGVSNPGLLLFSAQPLSSPVLDAGLWLGSSFSLCVT